MGCVSAVGHGGAGGDPAYPGAPAQPAFTDSGSSWQASLVSRASSGHPLEMIQQEASVFVRARKSGSVQERL